MINDVKELNTKNMRSSRESKKHIEEVEREIAESDSTGLLPPEFEGYTPEGGVVEPPERSNPNGT